MSEDFCPDCIERDGEKVKLERTRTGFKCPRCGHKRVVKANTGEVHWS